MRGACELRPERGGMRILVSLLLGLYFRRPARGEGIEGEMRVQSDVHACIR